MNRGRTGIVYATTTVALLAAIGVSGLCWGSPTVRDFGNLWLRSACLAIWAFSGLLLALSQMAFLVIALRTKHYVVILFTSATLLAIAFFVFLLSIMPS